MTELDVTATNPAGLDDAATGIQKARAIVNLIAAAEQSGNWNNEGDLQWAALVVDELLCDALATVENQRAPKVVEVSNG